MSSRRLDPQPDLFKATDRPSRDDLCFEPPGLAFVASVRSELHATLATAQRAGAMPWPDMTQALLAEIRFKSMSDWLPQAEAETLRDAFESELVRLYASRDAAYPDE